METRTDKQSEEMVIAHLLRHPNAWDYLSSHLCEDCFNDTVCNTLYKAIKHYRGTGNTPDAPYLSSVFQSRNRMTEVESIDRIVKFAPNSTDYMQQVDILENLRQQRVMYKMAMDILDLGESETEQMRELIRKANEDMDKKATSSIIDKVGLMNKIASTINENLDPNRVHKEVYTGFRLIDEMGGLPPGTEVVVAAFSSQGKTAWALSVVNNAMQMGVNTAIYSMEMGAVSIGSRFLNMMNFGVRTITLKTQPLFENTVADFNAISQQFLDRPGDIFIDESSNNNVDNICASIRMLHRTKGIQLAMVDYLQIIPVYDNSGDSDQEQLAKISRKLQATARRLDICIIVLSQFSRPLKGMGHQPSEDLIRGSGQIFEACDISIYVYRPEKWGEQYPAPFTDAETKGTAMIKIGKYRDGESDVASIVAFDGSKTLFYDFPEKQYNEKAMFNYPKAAVAPEMKTVDHPF